MSSKILPLPSDIILVFNKHSSSSAPQSPKPLSSAQFCEPPSVTSSTTHMLLAANAYMLRVEYCSRLCLIKLEDLKSDFISSHNLKRVCDFPCIQVLGV
ncbi:uncharacterized protein C8R40DRAFT_1079567, partial [Lentinula edodes]|uniref:uncharacterized protein n=1 Tax=Lentinula edodes TaxID=5353 RepID=UPI001E8E1351